MGKRLLTFQDQCSLETWETSYPLTGRCIPEERTLSHIALIKRNLAETEKPSRQQAFVLLIISLLNFSLYVCKKILKCTEDAEWMQAGPVDFHTRMLRFYTTLPRFVIRHI